MVKLKQEYQDRLDNEAELARRQAAMKRTTFETCDRTDCVPESDGTPTGHRHEIHRMTEFGPYPKASCPGCGHLFHTGRCVGFANCGCEGEV